MISIILYMRNLGIGDNDVTMHMFMNSLSLKTNLSLAKSIYAPSNLRKRPKHFHNFQFGKAFKYNGSELLPAYRLLLL